ncbi:nitroreductase family protein [Clostridium polynesiense]|uniref:nitroreductase family protein n=1 Tax=Clostridium polynesiense TaxID=1325933 RepID=UPI00058C6F6B|nr:nitroreductase family protein [Clostridium polynesiense]
MDVLSAIKERRSIRKFSSKPVEKEKLNKVLEAGRLAPSARNTQPWRFIVVDDKELIQRLYHASQDQHQVLEAPIALVVCTEGLNRTMMCGQPSHTVDASIALSFMMLEAQEQGLGTCWLGMFDPNMVRAILDIPEDVMVMAITPLGYAEEIPEHRSRKSIDDIVYYNGYK